jgi:hypothetical protein
MTGRILKSIVVAAAPLLLLGCLLTPGKFVSSLDIANDGSFTFRYQGELILVTSQSVMKDLAAANPFTPECTDEAGDSRECTAEETAEQRKTYDDAQDEAKAKEAEEGAKMAALLGGIDPSNEATMTEFAVRLQREAGWKTVTHRGGGIFDVDYEMSGKLDRDFVFPIFPKFDFIVPAVIITRRDDNAILVRAPGFGDAASATASTGGMGPAGGASRAEGVFSLRTNAAIATNNSEEGAVTDGGRQTLEWRITPINRTAPEALLRLSKF